MRKGRNNIHHLSCHISFLIYSSKCGVLFITQGLFQNLYSDKQSTPHFLFSICSQGANCAMSTFMKLIVLAGNENCGKTESLNKLADRIKEAGGKCQGRIQLGNPKKNDWEYDFSIQKDGKELKLVVSTWGDYWWTLNQCCEKYCDYDAIACACNLKFMRGKTHRPFEDAIKYDSLATVVLKSRESDESKYDEANDKCSKHLFDLVKHFGLIQ